MGTITRICLTIAPSASLFHKLALRNVEVRAPLSGLGGVSVHVRGCDAQDIQ